MKQNKHLQIGMGLAALAGLIDSLYLTGIKLTNTEASCFKGFGDCTTVNTSRYSEVMGIPVAAFGAAAYLALLALLFLELRGVISTENSKIGIFGISLAGTLYSAYLTYVEIAVIKAICPYCVLSALLILTIFALSIVRLSHGQMIQIPRQEET